jgi:hypothetical protein
MTTTATTAKGKKLRKQQEKSLRRKSRGFITEEKRVNTKTVFDPEVDAADVEEEVDDQDASTKPNDQGVADGSIPVEANESGDEDEEDETVEEVTKSAAKEALDTLQEQEAKAVAGVSKQRHRKKRAASPPPPKQGEDKELEGDDLDESFFEQLDAEKLQQKQANKRAKQQDPVKRQGKHITFDASGDDPERQAKVGDELYVQVLSENPQEQLQQQHPQRTIHQLIIASGQVPPTEKQKRKTRLPADEGKDSKNNNNEQKKSTSLAGWVRSAKMQRLSFGSRRTGQAAVNFVKR